MKAQPDEQNANQCQANANNHQANYFIRRGNN